MSFMAMNQGRSDAMEHAATCVSCRGDLRTLFSISMLMLPFARFAASSESDLTYSNGRLALS